MTDTLELMRAAAEGLKLSTPGKDDRSERWLRFGKYDLEFQGFEYVVNNDLKASLREGLRVTFLVKNHKPLRCFDTPEERLKVIADGFEPYPGTDVSEVIRDVIEEEVHTPGSLVVRTYNILRAIASPQGIGLEDMLRETNSLFGALWLNQPTALEGGASDWFDSQIEEHGLDPDGEFNAAVFDWFRTQVKNEQETMSDLFKGSEIGLDLVPGKKGKAPNQVIKTFPVKKTGETGVDKRHYWLVRS
jgi:hypothetical protein